MERWMEGMRRRGKGRKRANEQGEGEGDRGAERVEKC